MKRDGYCTSAWQSRTLAYVPQNNLRAGELPTNEFDVVIVGGGITGISTALKLQKAGKKCIVLEAHNLGFGTTGGTSAHLNTILDTPYYQIANDFGKENAQLVASAARNAIEWIKRNVDEHNIECDFKEVKGYIFAQIDTQIDELQKLLDSANEVKEHVVFADKIPIPIPFQKAIVFDKQAQFNPIEYLHGIAEVFESIGGIIIEDCRVTHVESDGKMATVTSACGEVKGRHLVYATHIPPGVNILNFTCAPYRSYVLAIKLRTDDYPNALVYDMYNPYRYYRTQEINGEKYLIFGGEDHKTAHEKNTEKCFRELESYARQFFNVQSVDYKWSSQYYEPADGLPYIGHLPGNANNIYAATGFGGNGLIYGTASALILSDLIVQGKSEYKDLFSPARIKPIAGFENAAKETADVAKNLVSGWLSSEKLYNLIELSRGEGKVVTYDGKKIALYKDEAGKLFAVNPACPHINCSVNWNTAEKSWDCPCHGSRFSCTGAMLTGPANTDLEKIDLRDK